MIRDDWRPTSENVNALPEPLRAYIRDIETRADPAGEVRELVLARDENRMLRARLARERGEVVAWLISRGLSGLARAIESGAHVDSVAWKAHEVRRAGQRRKP